MKFLPSQLVYLFHKRENKRNVVLLLRFLLVLASMVTVYSFLFHYIMMWEGQKYSWVTGFYWTLTVMSTLGFGDITFNSDLGRLFSIVVLMSGVVFLLILLPFTFIEFFYAPWIEAQAAARTPRQLPATTSGHVILTNYDPVSASLIKKLQQFHYDYVLLVPSQEDALRLADMGIRVVMGEIDNPDTYRSVNADRSSLVVATHDDMVNSNVSFTVREIAAEVPIVVTCNTSNSIDVLSRAGATRVLQLGEMMGKALARCTVGGDAVTHLVGNVDELLIAEANTSRTPLVGKSLKEIALNEFGINVLGIWNRGTFQYATAETVIGPQAILVMAGSSDNFQKYDEQYAQYNVSDKPVVILGGGRVGRAAARGLETRGIGCCIVEQIAERIPKNVQAVIGNAADIEVLREAGLMEAPAVLITTHDDNLNVYLTIYCRSLRPDMQIISRSTLERNTDTLHRAGADFVFSYASMGATQMFNLIDRSRIVTITEGLNVIRTIVPDELAGQTIASSGLREKTGCSVVAVRGEPGLDINPGPDTALHAGCEIILVGDAESEQKFLQLYGDS